MIQPHQAARKMMDGYSRQALLQERFGGWKQALERAGLPLPASQPKNLKSCAIYKEELARIRADKKRANEEKYRRAAEGR